MIGLLSTRFRPFALPVAASEPRSADVHVGHSGGWLLLATANLIRQQPAHGQMQVSHDFGIEPKLILPGHLLQNIFCGRTLVHAAPQAGGSLRERFSLMRRRVLYSRARFLAAGFVACAFVASASRAEASCGDWLAHDVGHSAIAEGAEPKEPSDSPVPAAPCRGPGCSKAPVAPAAPAPLPTVQLERWACVLGVAAGDSTSACAAIWEKALLLPAGPASSIFRPPR